MHDLNALSVVPADLGIDIVVSGHSHRVQISTRDDVLYLNPGSAGRRRFKLPITLATLALDTDGPLRHHPRPRPRLMRPSRVEDRGSASFQTAASEDDIIRLFCPTSQAKVRKIRKTLWRAVRSLICLSRLLCMGLFSHSLERHHVRSARVSRLRAVRPVLPAAIAGVNAGASVAMRSAK
ncbi:metallophosphoesterase family protein [Bradyrhizobium sp. 142]|uniref:metallophosphoesterase family protein n=1 Tax=Bradyrhizobium sp. 142 TaxID=2782618 RepID=UPI00320B918C|nr:metallophosphoesterase family protein [Bradyrhizobium sp. 142]